MVGFGPNFPKRIHHRGSSLPSLASHPQSIGCDGGFQPFFYSSNQNPNILVGAIVGGPNQNDGYPDDRSDYSHSEPATYINAAMVGPLAYFAGLTAHQLTMMPFQDDLCKYLSSLSLNWRFQSTKRWNLWEIFFINLAFYFLVFSWIDPQNYPLKLLNITLTNILTIYYNM